MQIVLKDFTYKGEHVNEVVFAALQRSEVDEVFAERIGEYILESLENLLKEES